MSVSQVTKTEQGVLFQTDEGQIYLTPITENMVRCVCTKTAQIQEPSILVKKQQYEQISSTIEETEETYIFTAGNIKVVMQKASGQMSWYNSVSGELYVEEKGKELAKIDVVRYTTGGEKPVINRVKTVDGERNFIQNLKEEIVKTAFRAKLYFHWDEAEGIYGLGQGEEGVYNYRGQNQYLYQHNMRIPMPVFLSDRCYGMFFDCGSLMTFNDDCNGSYVYLDTVDQLDYYFMTGNNFDQVIDNYRYLTGKATMLPKWAYGYVQSKEQYYTAKELVEIAQEYRNRRVPLDCVVQDWNSWEPGNWGEKRFDKNRFGDAKEQMEKLHSLNVHSMISVWPNMNTGGKNHTEFFEHGYLLNDYSTYNAFSEDARAMYWKQASEELFASGFDSWWCDSTEPFSGPDWGGEVKREPWERFQLVGGEHKKFLDADKANLFALMHAKGIYENQKKETKEKRVLNLTRSGYTSGHQYGAVLWSGDTCASWDTFRKQIVEGLNMAMSGYPYWTLDIGAFFTVGKKWQNRGCGCNTDPTPKWFWQGQYDEGVKDKGYCELYTRWLQMGTFLPMFRSHGTDTPREIWNFGEKGTMFYDAIEKFIHLRYDLMPYIYSLAYEVCAQNGTIMRSLLFDFLGDEKARGIWDQFLFGKYIMVCPVLEPMYYESGSKEIHKEKIRTCYLPRGCDWYDYWTNEKYEGGQEVTMDAPIDTMPIFVKAGAIIPMAKDLQYANQKSEDPLTICVYPGADGTFTLYEDEGDTYRYEDGEFTIIPFIWNEAEKMLTIGKREGAYPTMEEQRSFQIRTPDGMQTIDYAGEEINIKLT